MFLKEILIVIMAAMGLVTSQNTSGALPKTSVNLPKLDQKTVASANEQQKAAGISDVCSQSLSRVARMAYHFYHC